MPKTSQPRWMAARTAARMTAFRPGASSPPVLSAMRRMECAMASGTGSEPRTRRRPGSAQRGANLLPGRVPAGAFLREDQPAVHADLEDPAAGFDELDGCSRELLPDAGLQTGGAGEVVSEPAVLDPHVHGATSSSPPPPQHARRSDARPDRVKLGGGGERCQRKERPLGPGGGIARGRRWGAARGAERRETQRGGMMVTEKDVKKALRRVKDPELDLDLVVLGLVYGVDITDGHVHVTMSLTTPMCPAAGQIVEQAKAEIQALEGVESAEVELTFEPRWTPERIDPIIRSALGI